MKKQYKFVEAKVKEKQLITALETGLNRPLTPQERNTINWLSDCDYHSTGVILDLFRELGGKHNETLNR
ncbi:hypothetical protein [Schinkia azotoformans]|uniref:hypothetical protein n=1 Tax=Schinkia azotoformans TaxID=1454 RepID=UPI002DBE385D|nr:hypothetical protein [Schinkia azotoformans]MEC1786055.1 hypothetical protein [Schinkia azotoformans]MED4420091.1 hypothetical protein [Schinkia azotoformans]